MQRVGCLSVSSSAALLSEPAFDAERSVQSCQHAVVVLELRHCSLLLVELRLQVVQLCASGSATEVRHIGDGPRVIRRG